MAALASPCNKICVIDAAAGICLGCGRNLVEIERWSAFTDRERADVMADLPRRLAALPQRPLRIPML